MKKIILNIGLPILLALVLQGCTQVTSSKQLETTLKLVDNKPTAVRAYARTTDVDKNSVKNKDALAWQNAWNEKLAKIKADQKTKLEKAKEKSTPKPAQKTVVKPAKPQRYSGKGHSRYNALIAKYARANGVPIKLAHAVIQIESTYRANARGRAGEIGLMQLRLSTARGIGYRGSARALYNPETNIKFGMKYLGKAYKLGGGSTCGAILKYNAGHGAKRMNPTSARYCKKVKRLI